MNLNMGTFTLLNFHLMAHWQCSLDASQWHLSHSCTYTGDPHMHPAAEGLCQHSAQCIDTKRTCWTWFSLCICLFVYFVHCWRLAHTFIVKCFCKFLYIYNKIYLYHNLAAVRKKPNITLISPKIEESLKWSLIMMIRTLLMVEITTTLN